jgi:hypothetical protein
MTFGFRTSTHLTGLVEKGFPGIIYVISIPNFSWKQVYNNESVIHGDRSVRCHIFLVLVMLLLSSVCILTRLEECQVNDCG